jgi:hypothetical protein
MTTRTTATRTMMMMMMTIGRNEIEGKQEESDKCERNGSTVDRRPSREGLMGGKVGGNKDARRCSVLGTQTR